MASRHVVLIIGLWLTILSCFPGCDWSDTESTEPQTVQISTPPDAAEATIFLGSSSKTVPINGEDMNLYITPAEDELGKDNDLLVKFTDSSGQVLPGSEVTREVYIGESGQTSINLQFELITGPYIRVGLAEGEIGIKIKVKGWNFGPNEDIEIYLDIKRPGAQPNTQTNPPKKASWASIRTQSEVKYQKAPGTARNGADEPVHSVNTKEDGSFEATFAVPSGLISDVLAREAFVRVEGERPGSRTQAPFTITDPYIYLDPATAAERAEITVTGLNFGADEEVQIKLGDEEIARAAANVEGRFKTAFRVPEGVPVGKTSVRVLGLNSGSEKTVTFTVSNGSIQVRPLTFGGGVVGRKITLKGSKFAANENVVIYLRGVKIAEATTDENGDFKATFMFPQLEASDEWLESVQARGEKSGCEATTPFMVVPGDEDVAEIRILPDEGFAGAGMTAEGFFFGEEEDVVIYLGNEEVARTQTDEWGYFRKAFKVPSHVSVGQYIYVEAVGEESGYGAGEGFYITVREPKIYVSPDKGFAGAEMTAEGYFFGEEENVVIYLDNEEVARTQTDEWGYLKTVFTVPSDVSVGETIYIKAVGEKSDYEAGNGFAIREPYISVSPSQGTIGAGIGVYSWDFGEKENVVIYLDNEEVARTQTDEWGYLSTTFRIPEDASVGETIIKAIGEESGKEAETEFTIREPYISVSPSEGPTGAQIGVYSYDFGEEENVVIYLGDKEVARTQTDWRGYFSTTFRVPEDIPIWETIIKAIGEGSGKEAETVFAIREPHISVSPSEGITGAEIRVHSGDFGEKENVVIYLGDEEVVRTQTDGQGYLSTTFRIPEDIPIGETIIKAIGEESGKEAETVFAIRKPYISVSPSGGTTGAKITVYSYDFGEEENVVIYLGDKEVARTQTDEWGGFGTTCRIPEDTPVGVTIIKAIGEESGSEAETEFTVRAPEIDVSSYEGTTGAEIRVSSDDFSEEENVVIYLGDKEVARTQTDWWGDFGTIFRIPEDTPVGETVIKAIGEESGVKAETEFTVREPEIDVYPDVSPIGAEVTVESWDFGEEENVVIYLGDREVAEATKYEWPYLKVTFRIPKDTPVGETLVVKAIGEKSGRVAEAEFTVAPTPVYVKPAEAAIGEEITVRGWNFGAKEEIRIDFGDVQKEIARATADENGHFEAAFEVPEGVSSGVTFIRVEGLESGAIGDAVFTVKP